MRKWILIFIPLLIGYQSLAAQDIVGCTQLLEDAREAYTAGMVELVPELLLPCLESGGLTGTLKQDAYKLVISAYLSDYLLEEADSLMSNFINDFPDYRAGNADPAEFASLLDTHLRARGVDPAKVVVSEQVTLNAGQDGTRPVVSEKRYRTPFVYRNSLGFIMGVNGTFPYIVEKYSIGDPALEEGSFGLAPGYQLGATMNLLLGRTMEISFGLQYNHTRFNYEASPFSFTSYKYDEYQEHLQIPVALLFKLNPESSGVSVFMRFGVVADYLLAASGAGTRSYTESLRDVVVEKTEISDSRTRINLHGLAGLGIRIPLEKAFVFFEARFTSSVFLVNRQESRYENQDLTWLIYHIDSDFRSQQLSLSAGIAWNL